MDPRVTHPKVILDPRNTHEKKFWRDRTMALDPQDPQLHVTHEIWHTATFHIFLLSLSFAKLPFPICYFCACDDVKDYLF